MTAQTLAADPDDPTTLIPLTTGRHSSLNIELAIGWELKKFYIYYPPNFNLQEIKSADAILGGRDAKVNGQFDIVTRKRAVLGAVTFDDVRVLNVQSNVLFNLTQILPYDPWERWPPHYNDTVVRYEGIYFNTNNSADSPCTALSTRFDVIGNI